MVGHVVLNPSTCLFLNPLCHPQGDIPASQMLNSLPGIDPARRDRLMEVLDIDPTWRMHLVSGAAPLATCASRRCGSIRRCIATR